MRKLILFFIAIIILLLVLLLIFDNKLFVEMSGSGKFKKYEIPFSNIKIEIPETTIITEEYPNSKEILFSGFMLDRKLNFYGYIQMWNISNLEKFLVNSKENSNFSFKSYKQEKVNINCFEGYLIDWVAAISKDHFVSGREYFIKKTNSKQVIRLTMFTNGNRLADKYKMLLEKIIFSINCY